MDQGYQGQAKAQGTRKQNALKIDLDEISARILLAPAPAPRLTKRGAIEALKPSLQKAIEPGHTPASLAALLKADGLTVAPRTLAAWLNIQSRPRSTKKPSVKDKLKSS